MQIYFKMIVQCMMVICYHRCMLRLPVFHINYFVEVVWQVDFVQHSGKFSC